MKNLLFEIQTISGSFFFTVSMFMLIRSNFNVYALVPVTKLDQERRHLILAANNSEIYKIGTDRKRNCYGCFKM